jgi:hypothetical protein
MLPSVTNTCTNRGETLFGRFLGLVTVECVFGLARDWLLACI